MANIANNTYLFYGDRTELVKCHEKLNELYEKIGSNTVCVDLTVENTVINGEWINYLEELSEGADSFTMGTESKWYGNPVYWHDWVKTNYPNLSVAFRCEEPSMGIFETVDPDNRMDEYVYICGSDITDEDMEGLPQLIKDEVYEGCICNTFIKDEVFNSEFQPSDLPDGMSCEEYVNTTYDEIRAGDEAYLAMLFNMKEKIQQGLPESPLFEVHTNDVHDAFKTDVNEHIAKWKENTTN